MGQPSIAQKEDTRNKVNEQQIDHDNRQLVKLTTLPICPETPKQSVELCVPECSAAYPPQAVQAPLQYAAETQADPQAKGICSEPSGFLYCSSPPS